MRSQQGEQRVHAGRGGHRIREARVETRPAFEVRASRLVQSREFSPPLSLAALEQRAEEPDKVNIAKGFQEANSYWIVSDTTTQPRGPVFGMSPDPCGDEHHEAEG